MHLVNLVTRYGEYGKEVRSKFFRHKFLNADATLKRCKEVLEKLENGVKVDHADYENLPQEVCDAGSEYRSLAFLGYNRNGMRTTCCKSYNTETRLSEYSRKNQEKLIATKYKEGFETQENCEKFISEMKKAIRIAERSRYLIGTYTLTDRIIGDSTEKFEEWLYEGLDLENDKHDDPREF